MDEEQMMNAAAQEDANFQKRKALAVVELAENPGPLNLARFGDQTGEYMVARDLDVALATQGLKIVEA